MPPSSRHAFLERVRQAVRDGNRPGDAADIPARGHVGYQGAGADPVERFRAELTYWGGRAYLVPDRAAAVAQVLELVRAKAGRKVLLGRASLHAAASFQEQLQADGLEVLMVDAFTAENCRDPFFAADIGISGVEYLIAETGTLVVTTSPGQPRSVSLLPPIHIAVAERSQLIPDLFDLFAGLPKRDDGTPEMPSCLTLITGPSKTGDIELRLVTGVHGPGELHVVLVTG